MKSTPRKVWEEHPSERAMKCLKAIAHEQGVDVDHFLLSKLPSAILTYTAIGI